MVVAAAAARPLQQPSLDRYETISIASNNPIGKVLPNFFPYRFDRYNEYKFSLKYEDRRPFQELHSTIPQRLRKNSSEPLHTSAVLRSEDDDPAIRGRRNREAERRKRERARTETPTALAVIPGIQLSDSSPQGPISKMTIKQQHAGSSTPK